MGVFSLFGLFWVGFVLFGVLLILFVGLLGFGFFFLRKNGSGLKSEMKSQ